MKNIVLFGGGSHGRYSIDIIRKEKKYNIVGIIDSVKDIGETIYGYPIIGRQEQIRELMGKFDIYGGIITIGDNWSRKIVYDCVINIVPDFQFVNAIHPSVVIGINVKLGVGIVAMAGVVINPDTIIGDFCFLGPGALLGYNIVVNEFASITTGSLTGGKVTIGKYTAITLGVTIMDRLNIGENTVVGSGSLVSKDLPDNVLAHGNPAKIIRKRQPGEKFLKSD